MSRSAKLPAASRRSTQQHAFRRLNHDVDYSERNKRRVIAGICVAVVTVAVLALAVVLLPLLS